MPPMSETYETHAKGIRILPGEWRPHYPWEHIAWVSPPWPSQDYIWLDFPEAVFTGQGLLFLSHVNPPIPTVFTDQPKVEWFQITNGIAFDRTLPNGVSFGGSLVKKGETEVGLELHIQNGSGKPLEKITLQTCAFLRAIKEFAAYTMDNKFVHVPDKGWIPYLEAKNLTEEKGTVKLGWRSGKAVADLPAMATRSDAAERYVVMTWYGSTLSLVGNYRHPCMHADPKFKDLTAGEGASISGALLFHEGPLDQFKLI